MTGITSSNQANKQIKKQIARGYDFIKILDPLNKHIYNSIMQTALTNNIPVKGRVPKAVELGAALESGQASIEHLSGYINPETADFIIDEGKIEHYAQKTKTSGVWNCPAITTWQKIISQEKSDALENHPGRKYLSGIGRFFLWKSLKAMRDKIIYSGSDYPARMAEIGYRMTNALHNVGANLILGTGSGNPYVFPGWSIHEELGHMVNAGLTPYEAIRMGTMNAAESLGKQEEFGTIAVGKRADLILVNENPLENVGHLKNFNGVMVRGNYFSEMQIREMMQKLVD
jgi:imidazolonepropionase-like amidohydrolase